MRKGKFHKKGFVSLLMFASFIIMSVTGIILYIVPHGRIAYWTNWKLFGLTKTDWANIHIIGMIMFVAAGIFHIYYNWKVFINYIKDKVSGGLKLKKELFIASLLSIFVVIGAIYYIPPLKYFLDLNEYIKNAWVTNKEYEPPFGHAELLSLKTFCKKMKIDLNRAVSELKANNIEIKSVNDSLEKIGKENNISPMHIYSIIKKFQIKSKEISIPKHSWTPEEIEKKFTGKGLGRKKLIEICKEVSINVNLAQKRLEDRGIKAKADETMREIASRYNMSPMDVLKMILIK